MWECKKKVELTKSSSSSNSSENLDIPQNSEPQQLKEKEEKQPAAEKDSVKEKVEKEKETHHQIVMKKENLFLMLTVPLQVFTIAGRFLQASYTSIWLCLVTEFILIFLEFWECCDYLKGRTSIESIWRTFFQPLYFAATGKTAVPSILRAKTQENWDEILGRSCQNDGAENGSISIRNDHTNTTSAQNQNENTNRFDEQISDDVGDYLNALTKKNKDAKNKKAKFIPVVRPVAPVAKHDSSNVVNKKEGSKRAWISDSAASSAASRGLFQNFTGINRPFVDDYSSTKNERADAILGNFVANLGITEGAFSVIAGIMWLVVKANASQSARPYIPIVVSGPTISDQGEVGFGLYGNGTNTTSTTTTTNIYNVAGQQNNTATGGVGGGSSLSVSSRIAGETAATETHLLLPPGAITPTPWSTIVINCCIMFFFEVFVSDWLVAKWASNKTKKAAAGTAPANRADKDHMDEDGIKNEVLESEKIINLLEMWKNRSRWAYFVLCPCMCCIVANLVLQIFDGFCVYDEGPEAVLAKCPD